MITCINRATESLIFLAFPASKYLDLAILTKTSKKSFLNNKFPGAPGNETTLVSINFLSIVDVKQLSSRIPIYLQKVLRSVYPMFGNEDSDAKFIKICLSIS